MRPFYLVIFFLPCSLSYSQSNQSINSPNVFDQLKKEVVEFKTRFKNDSTAFPFPGIKIIDKRYDTSAIGYIKFVGNVKENQKLVARHGLTSHLETFLNSLTTSKLSQSKCSLVIVLRKFWFYKNYNFNKSNNFRSPKTSYFLNLKFDCFLYADSVYTALIRKDTLIQIPKTLKAQDNGTLIGQALQTLLNTLPVSKPEDLILNKRKFNLEELNEYYNKNFRQAIITDEELKRGVYMSFDE